MTTVYKGAIFGSLTALELTKRTRWRCRCACGQTVTVPAGDLLRGHDKSCGCLQRSTKKHGHTWEGGKSPTYRAWQNMLARCTQPSNPSYPHYRDLGITVCKRWRSFDNFLADMGERPGGPHEYTVERLDNSGNYRPGNCQWATWRAQGNNRSTNVRFEYRGRMYTLPELARETGVSKELLRARLVRAPRKWTVAGAVETPVLPKGSHFCR